MHVPRLASIAACLVGLVGAASPAGAQAPRPERPYRGLFAGGVGDAQQSLVAHASFAGGYDDNIFLDLPGVGGIDPRNAQKGSLGSGSGSLSYSSNTDRSTFGSSIGSQVRYYPGQADPYVGAHAANVGGSLRLGPRTTLSGGQSVAYQPYTFSSIFPTLFDPMLGQLDEPRLDQATSTEEYWSYNSKASLGHSFSPRVSFTSNYTFQQSDTAYGGGTFTRQGGYAGFGFTLSRGLVLRLGYGLQEGHYPNGGDTVRNHTGDIGVDFSRALSFSRRTSVSFTTGTAVLERDGNTSYRATGSARLNHEIGRSWSATAGYDRSVRFVDLLLEPVLSDSVDANLGGLVSRRVQVQSGVRVSIGTIGFGSTSRNSSYDTYQATANFSVALTRSLQLGTTYSFFHYTFDDAAVLPVGVAQDVDRQSVRVYMSLWAPLVNKARR